MSRPRVLDVFCGAGGMAKGLHNVGFEVVGVDKYPQPRYPYEFVQMDALQALQELVDGMTCGYWADEFVAVHASCPCQARSDLQKQSKIHYEEFVPRTRELLKKAGLPYVIENVEGTTDVPGAELIDPVMLCGTMFPGLRVIRHRYFEVSGFELPQPPHIAADEHPLVFTYDKRKAHKGKLDQNTSFVQVTGGGNCTVANKRDAMGIDWMLGREVNEAIPPAYGEYVGGFLLTQLSRGELGEAA